MLNNNNELYNLMGASCIRRSTNKKITSSLKIGSIINKSNEDNNTFEAIKKDKIAYKRGKRLLYTRKEL